MKAQRHEAYLCGRGRLWWWELKWLLGRPAEEYGINCIVFGSVPIIIESIGYFRQKLHYFISQNRKILLGIEDILASLLSLLPPLPGSQVNGKKWNEKKKEANKISISPDRDSGVVFLDPPGLGSIDGLPINPQPDTNLPQPLLKHRDNHAIWICPDVQQVVTAHCHHTHEVLRTECVRIMQNHRIVHLKMTGQTSAVGEDLLWPLTFMTDGRSMTSVSFMFLR